MRKLALGMALVLAAWLVTSAQEPTREGRRGSAPPAVASQTAQAQWEYRAMTRSDVAGLAPKPAGYKADIEEPIKGWPVNPESLSRGLNILGDQGWDLVAIEPFFRLEQGDLNFHYGPTYIFERKK